jgi:hypothetical protein
LRGTVPNALQPRIDSVIGTDLIEERSQHPTPRMEGRPLVWEGWINENRRSITHALSTLYAAENEGRLIARWSISLLYAAGFTFLGWSSLLIFSKVIRAVIGLQ